MSILKTKNQTIIIKRLKGIGNELLNKPYDFIQFTKNKEADILLNDLDKYPHAFVLACIMDRQIKTERAWLIPYLISKELNSFEMSDLIKKDENDYFGIFKSNNLHRFNTIMAKNFFEGIQKIHNTYNDNASLIWLDYPMSATLIGRFLSFKGAGIKIATMAANILVRDFKIKIRDHVYIDISPDIHLWRVFKRTGLIEKDSTIEELIYKARELNPDYPGVLDLSCWEIGRNWCKPLNPKCNKCYLGDYCEKRLDI